METFKKYYDFKKKIVETHLKKSLNKTNIPASLKEAMLYSLMAGGKRLRPVLVLMCDDAINNRFSNEHSEDILSIATSLEYIHTYSLIHDDLPAMDNDDLRRGMPTSHKKFGEATAILAGDALLTHAFSLLLRETSSKNLEAKIKIFQKLADAAGATGMVAGQILDMEGEKRSLSLKELQTMHKLKTGKLIQIATLLPAIYYNKTELLSPFETYGAAIGLAFQIADDILDVTSTDEELGKPVGSDEKNNKTTYVSLKGLEVAKKEANKTANKAILSLKNEKLNSIYLCELAKYIVERTN